MEKKELELYVHIPFCVKKCAYCDFLSAPADVQERTLYVDALTREIRAKKEMYKKYRVSTVFVGGGTPSVLDGSEIERIFSAVRDNFDVTEDAEITMEVNPGTVTEEKAAAWKACGITRLSIGLQSANDKELRMLGRIHSFQDFLATWETVRGAGFENVNIDLISAIPGQTLQSWENTLLTAAELHPEHISAYSLIIEKGTPFYRIYGEEAESKQETGNCPADRKEYPPLPDEDTERKIYKATESILAGYGLYRYEISNYAKPGYECRHNLGYWERKEYLGLGLGAASLVNECRFRNTSDIKKYQSEEEDIREEIEVLSAEDRMEEFMFLGLRKTEGISMNEFALCFGRDIRQVYGGQLRLLTEQGLIESVDDRIRLTERGTDISNYVFSEFLF